MSPLWCHQQGAGELLLLKGEGKVVLALGNPPVDGRWHRDMPSITLPPSGLRSRAKSSAPEPGAGDARPGTGRCFPGSRLQEKPCQQRAGWLNPFPSTARSCWRAGDGMGARGHPAGGTEHAAIRSRNGSDRGPEPRDGAVPRGDGTGTAGTGWELGQSSEVQAEHAGTGESDLRREREREEEEERREG